MKYEFATLSPEDFENLSRDLVGAAIGVRFEAFTVGADDGMDGRCTNADGSIILQAKHYFRSGFSKLKSKMREERVSIDELAPQRYILTTSVPLTPANKAALAEIIGPSLAGTGDIFGADDLNALLRSYPEIVKAHEGLWAHSTPVLEQVVTNAVRKAMAPAEVPPTLARLMPPLGAAADATFEPAARDTIFVIKSSPIDDEFTLWLAPKLEAEGYQVFADVLTLMPGERWRREITSALRHRAIKVLLLCRDSSLEDTGVQDDLDIALEVGKEICDQRFVIPLRMETFRKIKGLGDTVAVDFVRNWGEGLLKLVDTLQRQKVPRSADTPINPNWEIFRRRGAVPIIDIPERLTSNWLRVAEAPDFIRYFECSGVINKGRLQGAIESYGHPCALVGESGFLAFGSVPEIEMAFEGVGRFKLKYEIPLVEFTEGGFQRLRIDRQTASNLVIAMLKKAWINFCKRNGFIEYEYSNGIGFHASPEQAPTGKRIPWGSQAEKKRSSMLRNSAKGHIWQFGVTAMPAFWPFWHFKLKSRVLFAQDNATPAGLVVDDPKKLHRLRRSICKGWRNKQWYGRLLAFLELLSADSAFVRLPLSETETFVLEASPMLFSSPVSTVLPNDLDDEDEELDDSTLGRPDNDEEGGE
ncbi:toll/interleukin-1 receptor domain-containing protein [Rhizobium sp. C4]|uniref:toll/interleukin-1 receptor domain-containing protein n=1 Tax=Rhizobium sp. C4 TaxID=1349800 RepID=UPI001E28451E|nr:toll/interleukin-1 receptor domain-containing protein [Rhizobium sp. C4]MCD2175071.1 toll/interleukin-1 receptor domain-containing protein [Rhizobium sp. C4]